MNIFDQKSYHFIGIGGIGISAIARMLELQGKKVTGSDGAQSLITEDLEELGIKVEIGQRSENIPSDAEVVIYTVAIKEDNPELVEAGRRGLKVVSYPEALGELSKNMFTIAISGTHGKTTTTAMIGHIMTRAGLDPTIIVGSKLLGQNSNFVAGKSKYLVVEACEYKRSFLNLHPEILVILNIDADHLDYYKDLDDIRSAFDQMASQSKKVIRYEDYSLVDPNINLLVPGKHNILDAQAAIKAVESLGINEETAKKYLEDFKGTWRRLEKKFERDGNVYYDDYAHHPTEIKASLQALKEKHPDKKLICVFEPHTQNRIKALFKDFVEVLKIADRSLIAPIYVTREVADDSISNKILAEAIGEKAEAVENVAEFKEKLASEKDFCVVLMGAGDIYKWTAEL